MARTKKGKKIKKPGLIGNKNAVGNKGGGRKSAYVERMMADKLLRAFEEPVDFDELDAKYIKKKISLFDLSLYRALNNPTVLMTLLNKVLPDLSKVDMKDDNKSKDQAMDKTLDALMRDIENKGNKFENKQKKLGAGKAKGAGEA